MEETLLSLVSKQSFNVGKWQETIPQRRNKRNKSLTSRWQGKVFFFQKVRPDETPKSARALPWVSIWLMLESVYLPSSYNNTVVGEFASVWAATASTKTQCDAASFGDESSVSWALLEQTWQWGWFRWQRCAVVAHLTGLSIFLFETHPHKKFWRN